MFNLTFTSNEDDADQAIDFVAGEFAETLPHRDQGLSRSWFIDQWYFAASLALEELEVVALITSIDGAIDQWARAWLLEVFPSECGSNFLIAQRFISVTSSVEMIANRVPQSSSPDAGESRNPYDYFTLFYFDVDFPQGLFPYLGDDSGKGVVQWKVSRRCFENFRSGLAVASSQS